MKHRPCKTHNSLSISKSSVPMERERDEDLYVCVHQKPSKSPIHTNLDDPPGRVDHTLQIPFVRNLWSMRALGAAYGGRQHIQIRRWPRRAEAGVLKRKTMNLMTKKQEFKTEGRKSGSSLLSRHVRQRLLDNISVEPPSLPLLAALMSLRHRHRL